MGLVRPAYKERKSARSREDIQCPRTCWSPPRSGPSPQPHSHSCHQRVAITDSSSTSEEDRLEAFMGVMGVGGVCIGGGVLGGGRSRGFGVGAWRRVDSRRANSTGPSGVGPAAVDASGTSARGSMTGPVWAGSAKGSSSGLRRCSLKVGEGVGVAMSSSGMLASSESRD